MIEIQSNPSPRQLRVFAGIAVVVSGGLGSWIAAGGGVGVASGTLWALAAYAALGLLRPATLRLFYVLLSLVMLPIGYVLSQVALGILYFGLVTPTGWLGRIAGRDVLGLRIDPEVQSYWVEKPASRDAESYFRQS